MSESFQKAVPYEPFRDAAWADICNLTTRSRWINPGNRTQDCGEESRRTQETHTTQLSV